MFRSLVVRVAGSDFYDSPELWSNAAVFVAKAGGKCGIRVQRENDSLGKISVFFDDDATPSDRQQFEDYVVRHLERWALTNGVQALEETPKVQRIGEAATYDVFLCYNRKDVHLVRTIRNQLCGRDIQCWFDEDMRAGIDWQDEIQRQIAICNSVAVFIGAYGLGDWQKQELHGIVKQFVARDCPVIPVILSNCQGEPPLPLFLSNFNRVDFRRGETAPLDKLVDGISPSR